jgi:hypothetical protein
MATINVQPATALDRCATSAGNPVSPERIGATTALMNKEIGQQKQGRRPRGDGMPEKPTTPGNTCPDSTSGIQEVASLPAIACAKAVWKKMVGTNPSIEHDIFPLARIIDSYMTPNEQVRRNSAAPERRCDMGEDALPAAGSPSRSISLLARIMRVIRDTPRITKSDMCHGEPHFYNILDYDRMEAEIGALLSNAELSNAILQTFDIINRSSPHGPEITRAREHWLAFLAERERRLSNDSGGE